MKRILLYSIAFKIKMHDKITIYRVQIKIKNKQILHKITHKVIYVNNALNTLSFYASCFIS